MLRTGLLVVGIACLVGGASRAVAGHWGSSTWLFINGALLVAGIVWERTIYKPLLGARAKPKGDPTGERFIDPTTGQLVEVLYDAVSGDRHYRIVE